MNPEETVDETVVEETVEEEAPEADLTDKDNPDEESKELQSALVQKDRFKEKLVQSDAEIEKLQKELSKLQAQAPKGPEEKGAALDVSDYIEISSTLNGLDQVEQDYLARQAKATGQSLKALREGEDFQNWQIGHAAKLEKEAALRPDTAQPVEDEPQNMGEALAKANLAEKEKMLVEAGLYKENRRTAERSDIGSKISTQ
jgi:hypothetical protein